MKESRWRVMSEQSNPSDLQRAIHDADLRVLLMCLVHLTGDLRWLEPPWRPRRDVRLIADPGAGLDERAATEIRQLVAARLAERQLEPVIEDPGEELLGRMMSVCLGEDVPAEYIPLMREDMGFTSGDAAWKKPEAVGRKGFHVLVVGAGLSGLHIAHKLDRLGVSCTVVEKNGDVGGTWLENRYPGCRVDTPNHFYSFSYLPSHEWQHYFSPQPELLRYACRFADTTGVRRLIRFSTELTGARWNDVRKTWIASTRGPQGPAEIEARVLVSAIGHFNRPVLPDIPGAGSFAGPLFHSARWPEGLDLRGKKVAVVGTGASSMQIVPSIVDEVAALTVYQRSPQWSRSVPEYRKRVRPGTRWLLEHVPYYAIWNRFTLFWRYGDGLLRSLRKDPDWPHPERSLNRTNERHRLQMLAHIESELAGRPDLIPKCVPTYPPYGKRILIDNGWFAALRRPHVELVTDPIKRIESAGIVTRDGVLREADVIVMATGFSVTDLSARLNIVGRNGKTLAEDWANDNPTAHLGMTVPGFPNFFCMFGPNSNLGHGGSGVFISETQGRYITKCVAELLEGGWSSLECRPEVRDEYVRRVDAEHAQMIWTHPGMSTYYRNRFGRVVSPMPFRLVDYWSMTHEPHHPDFHWSR